MADTTVSATTGGDTDNFPGGASGPFYAGANGLVVYIDANQDLAYRTTTDNGVTWSSASVAFAGTVNGLAVFYDGQQPGLSTDTVHAVFTDGPSNKVKYQAFDVSSGTLGTATDIATPTTTDSTYPIGVTVSRNGHILAFHHVLGGSQVSQKSIDSGATWSAILSPWSGESGTDQDSIYAFSCNTGDDSDAAIIYGDLTGSQWSVKVYDDSANTWNKTNIVATTTIFGVTSGVQQASWAANSSNSHVYFAVWTESDAVTADLLFFDLTMDSVAAPPVTARTDVVTNSAESATVSLVVDHTSQYVYAAYLRGGTWGSSVTAYYKISTDGGVTWGVETQYSNGAGAYDGLGIMASQNGVQTRIQWSFLTPGGGLLAVNAVILGAASTPTVTLTGTIVPAATEDAVAAGALTLIATITNGLTWASTVDDDATTSEDFISALLSAGSEALGWNNVVVGKFYKREVLADSPLSYYRLGGSYTDLGSVANNGTATALGSAAALLLSSVQASSSFNAATSKVTITDVAGIRNIWDGGGTAEVITKPWSSGFSVDNSKIFSKINAGAGWEIGVWHQSGGYVDIYFRQDFSTVQGVWEVSARIPVGVQTHFAVTYNSDSASNDPTFYINGVAVVPTESTTPSGTRSSDTGSTLYLGSNSSVALTYNGQMQEAALYTTALSATRIQAHVLAASNRYGLRYSNLTRTSGTVVTLTMPAFPFYNIAVAETITATFPVATFTSSAGVVVATPTFQITPTTRNPQFTPPTNVFTTGAQTTGPFGNVNGGLGPSAGAAYRVLGAGDTWALGSPELAIGIDGASGQRVLLITATEVSEA